MRVASSGEEGFFLVNHETFDCVVLDLMLLHRDGLEVLTTLRKRGLQTPVLIPTAKDTVSDRVASTAEPTTTSSSRSGSRSCSPASARSSGAGDRIKSSSSSKRILKWIS